MTGVEGGALPADTTGDDPISVVGDVTLWVSAPWPGPMPDPPNFVVVPDGVPSTGGSQP